MEIEDAIFQDLESVGKERILKTAVERFWSFVWKCSKNILECMWLGCVLNTVMVCLFILLFIIRNTIYQSIITCIVKKGAFLLLWGFKMRMKMSNDET